MRWTQGPEHCPNDAVLLVPPPHDVLLAWTISQQTEILTQATLKSGYEQLQHWHQQRQLALRCDLKNTEPTQPHLQALIQELNRWHPDVLEMAYRLRGVDGPTPNNNLDLVAAWFQCLQDMNNTIALQQQLLEQHQQQQRSSRNLISRLLSES